VAPRRPKHRNTRHTPARSADGTWQCPNAQPCPAPRPSCPEAAVCQHVCPLPLAMCEELREAAEYWFRDVWFPGPPARRELARILAAIEEGPRTPEPTERHLRWEALGELRRESMFPLVAEVSGPRWESRPEVPHSSGVTMCGMVVVYAEALWRFLLGEVAGPVEGTGLSGAQAALSARLSGYRRAWCAMVRQRVAGVPAPMLRLSVPDMLDVPISTRDIVTIRRLLDDYRPKLSAGIPWMPSERTLRRRLNETTPDAEGRCHQQPLYMLLRTWANLPPPRSEWAPKLADLERDVSADRLDALLGWSRTTRWRWRSGKADPTHQQARDVVGAWLRTHGAVSESVQGEQLDTF